MTNPLLDWEYCEKEGPGFTAQIWVSKGISHSFSIYRFSTGKRYWVQDDRYPFGDFNMSKFNTLERAKKACEKEYNNQLMLIRYIGRP
jgi:hypothetical protein